MFAWIKYRHNYKKTALENIKAAKANQSAAYAHRFDTGENTPKWCGKVAMFAEGMKMLDWRLPVGKNAELLKNINKVRKAHNKRLYFTNMTCGCGFIKNKPVIMYTNSAGLLDLVKY